MEFLKLQNNFPAVRIDLRVVDVLRTVDLTMKRGCKIPNGSCAWGFYFVPQNLDHLISRSMRYLDGANYYREHKFLGRFV